MTAISAGRNYSYCRRIVESESTVKSVECYSAERTSYKIQMNCGLQIYGKHERTLMKVSFRMSIYIASSAIGLLIGIITLGTELNYLAKYTAFLIPGSDLLKWTNIPHLMLATASGAVSAWLNIDTELRNQKSFIQLFFRWLLGWVLTFHILGTCFLVIIAMANTKLMHIDINFGI